MASAERIQLIRCPRCSERVIAPPRSSAGIWECPFCRRRFRRKIHSSAASSGTIPAINLFSRHPWPQDEQPSGFAGILQRGHSALLAGYATSLLALMVVYHIVVTVLGVVGFVVRLPLSLWETFWSEDGSDERPPGWSLGRALVQSWLPHFRTPNPDSEIGPRLDEREAPGIFVIVAEMSRKVGAAAPDEIRVTHLPCCGVIEQRNWAGLRPSRRVLVIGLPLLYVLSVEELRAVVAHELGHLSRGDAALAFVVSQFMDSLQQTIAAGSQSRYGWLKPRVAFAWFGRFAFRVLGCALSRHQEYRADALAAAVCGADVVSNSLRTAALVQPIFKEVLCTYHPIVVHDANLYQFFRAAWLQLPDGLKEEMKEALVADEQAEFCGPHPTLRARMRRLERHANHRDPDERPARRLLVNRRQLETALHDSIYRTRPMELSLFRPAGEP